MAEKEAPSTSSADGELKLTPQETKLFTHVVKQLPKTVDIDWEILANELGLKNADVAKTRFRQIRTKYGIYGPPRAPASGPAASNPLGPKNAASKVLKRKQTKPKKPKAVHGNAVADDNDNDSASNAQDGEA